MINKGKKGRTKSRNSKKTTRPAISDTKLSAASTGKGPTAERFVKDLLVRGEAAPLTANGKLPLSATHVIDSQQKDGTASVRRVRYKLF